MISVVDQMLQWYKIALMQNSQQKINSLLAIITLHQINCTTFFIFYYKIFIFCTVLILLLLVSCNK
jgi:hypothetical protein